MAGRSRNVLVCDDDASVRDVLVQALRAKSMTTDEARDGREAIEMLRENRYSVVLLDLMMPGVDGLAVLDAIDHETHPPVVLVVSGAGRQVLDRVDTKKVHGVVKKPFDPIEIAEIVAACAHSRGPGAFETMAIATMAAAPPLIELLKL